MARRKASNSQITIGNLADVSGEVNIASGDIVKNFGTIYQKALTVSEEAVGTQMPESKLLAEGVSRLAQTLSAQADRIMESETPYKGLLAYSMYEPEIFYGRAKARKQLLSVIKRGALGVMHGDASVGKTSLLQAGLAATLTGAGHLALPLRPYADDPVDVIKRMFLPNLSQTPAWAAAPLREFLREVCSVLGPNVNLCLLIDQFEEFFRLRRKEERRPFLESLADCLNDPGLKVRWVLSVRSESLGDLAELEAFGITPFSNTYRLNPLNRAEAREAIIEPARRYDINFEPEPVDHILDSLMINGEVAPTHLQLVCCALVDHLPENKTLTLEHLEQEGGVEGIFRDHLKRQLDNLPSQERALAWKALRALVSSDQRRMVRTREEIVQELKRSGAGEQEVNTILERLVARRLLFELPVTPKTFELAHDYLVREIALEPQEQARKAAQELLDQEVRTYRRFRTLLPEERLAVISPYMKELMISAEAQELLNASQAAIQRARSQKRLSLRSMIQDWLSPASSRTEASERPAEQKPVRRVIEVAYRKYALVIGNNLYDDSHFAQLKAPEVDVYALAEILLDKTVGGFQEVQTLVNQPSSEIEPVIADFCRERSPNELMLLYFSGHGILDSQGNLYLAAKNTPHDRPPGRAIKSQFITERMDESRCKRQILILDCCHSGAFHRGSKGAVGRKAITEATFEGKGYGRVVLTATDATQYAWENEQIIGEANNSVFTSFLIEGLKSGAADLDQDGWITVDEMYDYIYQQSLSKSRKQTPGKWTYRQQGQLFIASNPTIE